MLTSRLKSRCLLGFRRLGRYGFRDSWCVMRLVGGAVRSGAFSVLRMKKVAVLV